LAIRYADSDSLLAGPAVGTASCDLLESSYAYQFARKRIYQMDPQSQSVLQAESEWRDPKKARQS